MLARHTTLNRWLTRYSCVIADAVRSRNKPANAKFFERMLEVNGPPREIDSDKSDANTAGINAINKMLESFGCPISIAMVRRKYPQSNVEQDQRFVKRRAQPMLGLKAFVRTAATLNGIGVAQMICGAGANFSVSKKLCNRSICS